MERCWQNSRRARGGFRVPSPLPPLSRCFRCGHSNSSRQFGLSGSGGAEFQLGQRDALAFQGRARRQRLAPLAKWHRGDPVGMGAWGCPGHAGASAGTALGTLLTPLHGPWDALGTSLGCPPAPEAPFHTSGQPFAHPHPAWGALCTPLWTLAHSLKSNAPCTAFRTL